MLKTDNSLKRHLKFVEKQVEQWPEWKKKAILTRRLNSQKRFINTEGM